MWNTVTTLILLCTVSYCVGVAINFSGVDLVSINADTLSVTSINDVYSTTLGNSVYIPGAYSKYISVGYNNSVYTCYTRSDGILYTPYLHDVAALFSPTSNSISLTFDDLNETTMIVTPDVTVSISC